MLFRSQELTLDMDFDFDDDFEHEETGIEQTIPIVFQLSFEARIMLDNTLGKLDEKISDDQKVAHLDRQSVV